MLVACDTNLKGENISIFIFKVPPRIIYIYIYYIPPLTRLGHGHIEVCFVLISSKVLINMVFNLVNMHFLTSLSIHVITFCIKYDSIYHEGWLVIAKHFILVTHCVNKVEYHFSPIFLHEWLRDNKAIHVLVYLFLYSIDITSILNQAIVRTLAVCSCEIGNRELHHRRHNSGISKYLKFNVAFIYTLCLWTHFLFAGQKQSKHFRENITVVDFLSDNTTTSIMGFLKYNITMVEKIGI